MARVYSDIRNFKQLEVDLRKIALALANAVKTIERTQQGKHSRSDLDALENARASWSQVHEAAKQALAQFWDDVEGSG